MCEVRIWSSTPDQTTILLGFTIPPSLLPHVLLLFTGACPSQQNKSQQKAEGAVSEGLHGSCRAPVLPVCHINAFKIAESRSGEQRPRTVIKTAVT